MRTRRIGKNVWSQSNSFKSIPENLFTAFRQDVDATHLFVEVHVLAITFIKMMKVVIETEIFHFDHVAFEHLVSFGGTFSIPELDLTT